MRLREFGIHLRDEKQVLRNGMILLGFAAVLVLVIIKFDHVWGAICTGFATISPLLYGIVMAYILNVFVHFLRISCSSLFKTAALNFGSGPDAL